MTHELCYAAIAVAVIAAGFGVAGATDVAINGGSVAWGLYLGAIWSWVRGVE